MNPCCGGSLRTGTIIIAVIELIFSVPICIFGIYTLAVGGTLAEGSRSGSGYRDQEMAAAGFGVMVAGLVVTFVGAVYLLFAILLLTGANKKSRTMCMVWFVVSFIGLILTLLKIVFGFVGTGYFSAMIPGLAGVLLQSYMLWVVWAFMTELKEEAAMYPQYNTKPRA